MSDDFSFPNNEFRDFEIPKIVEHSDGRTTVEDDYGFDDLASAMSAILGWCGCGRQEVALEYLAGGLRLIAEISERRELHGVGRDAWYKEYRKRVDGYFNGEGAEYLFYYLCDFHGLIEHGGSVPGWLTDKGKALIKWIAKLPKEEEDGEPRKNEEVASNS